jgi:GH24 family phage-related lysozyme (muramidase)
MRHRPSESSDQTPADPKDEAGPELSAPSSRRRDDEAGESAATERGGSRERDRGGRTRRTGRARRQFLGDVTCLETKPLFSGMTLDSIGLNFIAAHELGPNNDQAGPFAETPTGPSGGFASVPYNNPAGNAAIGYGHRLHDGNVDATDHVNYPQPIDQAQASALLTKDVAKAVTAVNADVKVALTQDQFDSLVDFAYNEGKDAFDKSTLLEDVNASQFGQVPAQLDQWVYGTINGQIAVIPGLVNRRNDESNLFEGKTADDTSGDGPANGFSAGHPGNTFAGIRNRGCSPGSGETGTGGGAGNIGGGGGGHHTAGGGHGTPITIINIRLLNSLQGYTTCDGYSSFGDSAFVGGSSPYAGSTPVNGNAAPYGTSPFCYSSPMGSLGSSPFNDYYSITGSAGGGGTGGTGGAGGGGTGGGGGGGGGGTVGGGGGGASSGGGGGVSSGGGGGGGGGDSGGGGGDSGGGGGDSGGGGGDSGGGGGDSGGGGGDSGGGGGDSGGGGSDVIVYRGPAGINPGGLGLAYSGGGWAHNSGLGQGSTYHDGGGGGFTNGGGGAYMYGGDLFTDDGGLGITPHSGGGGMLPHVAGGGAGGNGQAAQGLNTADGSSQDDDLESFFAPSYAVAGSRPGLVADDSIMALIPDSLESQSLLQATGEPAVDSLHSQAGAADAPFQRDLSTSGLGDPPAQEDLMTMDAGNASDLLTTGEGDSPGQGSLAVNGAVDAESAHELGTIGKPDPPNQPDPSPETGTLALSQQDPLTSVIQGEANRTDPLESSPSVPAIADSDCIAAIGFKSAGDRNQGG